MSEISRRPIFPTSAPSASETIRSVALTPTPPLLVDRKAADQIESITGVRVTHQLSAQDALDAGKNGKTFLTSLRNTSTSILNWMGKNPGLTVALVVTIAVSATLIGLTAGGAAPAIMATVGYGLHVLHGAAHLATGVTVAYAKKAIGIAQQEAAKQVGKSTAYAVKTLGTAVEKMDAFVPSSADSVVADTLKPFTALPAHIAGALLKDVKPLVRSQITDSFTHLGTSIQTHLDRIRDKIRLLQEEKAALERQTPTGRTPILMSSRVSDRGQFIVDVSLAGHDYKFLQETASSDYVSRHRNMRGDVWARSGVETLSTVIQGQSLRVISPHIMDDAFLSTCTRFSPSSGPMEGRATVVLLNESGRIKPFVMVNQEGHRKPVLLDMSEFLRSPEKRSYAAQFLAVSQSDVSELVQEWIRIAGGSAVIPDASDVVAMSMRIDPSASRTEEVIASADKQIDVLTAVESELVSVKQSSDDVVTRSVTAIDTVGDSVGPIFKLHDSLETASTQFGLLQTDAATILERVSGLIPVDSLEIDSPSIGRGLQQLRVELNSVSAAILNQRELMASFFQDIKDDIRDIQKDLGGLSLSIKTAFSHLDLSASHRAFEMIEGVLRAERNLDAGDMVELGRDFRNLLKFVTTLKDDKIGAKLMGLQSKIQALGVKIVSVPDTLHTSVKDVFSQGRFNRIRDSLQLLSPGLSEADIHQIVKVQLENALMDSQRAALTGLSSAAGAHRTEIEDMVRNIAGKIFNLSK